MAGRKPLPQTDMKPKEILELLVLKEWTRPELAQRLGVSENLVYRWFCKTKASKSSPSPENVAKMRKWLAEAREEAHKQPA